MNLNKTNLGTGSGAARYPLIADGSNLLIIKHKSVWTDKEFIVTPAEEYFSQAVTWGTQSNYSTVLGSNNSDALSMQSRLAAIRDRKTTSSWYEGHKPMFAYWARSFPPYRIQSDSGINSTTLKTTMELGSCWKLLRFNLFGLPTGRLSSFSAYWRVWNPSCVETWDISPQGLQPIHYAQTWLHNGAGVMRYCFSSTVQPPNFHQSTGYGEADIAAVSNEGHGSDYSNFESHKYDIFNAHNGVAATSSSNNFYGKEQTYLYYKKDGNGQIDSAHYYADIPITGDGLTSLKNAIKDRTAIWAHCGFPTLDAQSAVSHNSASYSGQRPYSCIFIYCSRLELRLVASWAKFNT